MASFEEKVLMNCTYMFVNYLIPLLQWKPYYIIVISFIICNPTHIYLFLYLPETKDALSHNATATTKPEQSYIFCILEKKNFNL
jgi:hypothetical protein